MTVEEKRYELDALLCEILGSDEVHFQPTESVHMSYPAIVYSRERFANEHANNNVYMQHVAYRITVIDPDPDSPVAELVSKLPMCRSDRHYKADNLNHDTFVLYW